MASAKVERCVASDDRYSGGPVVAMFNWARELDGSKYRHVETVISAQGATFVSQPLPDLPLTPRVSGFGRHPASQLTAHGKGLLIEHVVYDGAATPRVMPAEILIARVDLETWDITNLPFAGRRDPHSKRHFAQANTSERVAIVEEWSEQLPTDRPRDPYVVHTDVWVLELDGTLRKLVTLDGSITPLSHASRAVQWSPDDTLLAVGTYAMSRSGMLVPTLHVLSVSTGTVTLSTRGAMQGSSNWSPDGTKLLSGDRRIYDLTTGDYHLIPGIPEDIHLGGGRPNLMGFADNHHMVTYSERHRGEMSTSTFGTVPIDGTEVTPQLRFTTNAFTYPQIVTPWPLPPTNVD